MEIWIKKDVNSLCFEARGYSYHEGSEIKVGTSYHGSSYLTKEEKELLKNIMKHILETVPDKQT